MSAPTIIAEIRTQDDLIEALRAAKDLRGLSNVWCDERLGLVAGHTDKTLGPSRIKGLSRMLFDTLHSGFAVKLLMVVDVEREAVMRPLWEGRDGKNVRVETGRVSQKLLERAKPLVLKENGALGGQVRALLLSPKQRSEIARKGGRARQRNRRKSMRERLIERKAAKMVPEVQA